MDRGTEGKGKGREGQKNRGKRKGGRVQGREGAREGGREAVVAREAGVVELPLGTGWCGWQQNMSRWQELLCGGWQHEATCEQ